MHDRGRPGRGRRRPAGRWWTRPAGGGLRGGPEEQRGLEALAADGQHRDEHQADAAGGCAAVDASLEVTGQAAGRTRHPHHHPGDEADRDDRQDAADGLLRLEAQARGART